MTPSRRRTPALLRLLATSALVVSALVVGGGGVVPTAGAAEPTGRLLVSRATAAPAGDGTQVRGSFLVKNRTGKKKASRPVVLFLVGGGRSYALGSAATPVLAKGAAKRVTTRDVIGPRVPAGSYAYRACIGPAGDRRCTTSAPSITVAPVVAGQREIRLDGDTSDFGPTAVGSTSDLNSLTLVNTGNVPTGPITVTVSEPFTLIGQNCETGIAPGQSCSLDLTFSPTMHEDSFGTLEFAFVDGGGGGYGLSGTSTELAVSPGPSFDFGEQPQGSRTRQVFTISNVSDTNVPVNGGSTNPEFGDGGFDIQFDPDTCYGEGDKRVVPANGSCTITYEYVARLPGTSGASFAMFSMGSGDVRVSMTGTSVAVE